MQYRPLGKTGLRVSEIGLGGWAIGGTLTDHEGIHRSYGQADDAVSLAAIRRAVEVGVTFFDSGSYGGGHSEELLGQALTGVRDRCIVETKCGTYYEGTRRFREFSEASIRRQLAQSLQRLRTDTVDVYLLHMPTADECRLGWETLLKLKQEGTVRFIGVSPAPGLAVARELAASGHFDVHQFSLNLLSWGSEQTYVPLAREYNTGIVIHVPLAQGFLTGTFTRDTVFPPDDLRSAWPRQRVEETLRKVDRLRFLVTDEVRTLAQASLKWILSHPEVSTIIAGAKSAAEVEDNAGASDGIPLPAADLAEVRRLHETSFAA